MVNVFLILLQIFYLTDLSFGSVYVSTTGRVGASGTSGDPFSTLSEALLSSSNVILFPGLYNYTGCYGLLLNSNTQISSTGSFQDTIVIPPSGKAFNVTSGSTVSFSNITFSGGGFLINGNSVVTFTDCLFDQISNGAIDGVNSNVTCTRCAFTGSKRTTAEGSAARMTGGFSTWNSCTISNNENSLLGAGFYFEASHTASVVNCDFHSNYIKTSKKSSGYGAGIACTGTSTISINGCSFMNNSATITDSSVTKSGRGGGIYGITCTTTIMNSLLESNFAQDDGGGSYFDSGFLKFVNVTLRKNRSGDDGGSSKISGVTMAVLTDVLFTENISGDKGGGFVEESSFVNATRLTFLANRAGGTGGGIDSQTGNWNILGYIHVLDNVAAGNGGGISSDGSHFTDLSGGSLTFRSNTGALGGNLYIINNASFVGSGFTFDNGTSTTGGGVYADNSALRVTNATITNNNAAVEGGGIYSFVSDMLLPGSTIAYNNAPRAGGILHSVNRRLSMDGSVFIGNTGCALSLASYNFTLNNVNFINNTGTDGAALIASDANINIRNCVFSGNQATGIGGAINFLNSITGSIVDSTFTRNSAKDAGAVAVLDAQITVTSSTFTNNIAKANGGVFKISGTSQMALSDSEASNNQASLGGVIFQDAFKSQAYSNCQFTYNTASQQGGVLMQSDGDMVGQDSDFSYNTALIGGAVSLSGFAVYSSNGTNYNNNHATLGGVIRAVGSATITIDDSDMSDNYASSLGGVQYLSDEAYLTLNTATLSNNFAASGGVVYIDGSGEIHYDNVQANNNTASNYGGFGCFYSSEINLQDSSFTNNKAQLGGAIYLDVANSSDPVLKHVGFLFNKAQSGAVLYWRVNSDDTPSCLNCLYKNNSATAYGDTFATNPHSMSLDGDFSTHIKILDPVAVPVRLQDLYNQTVTSTNDVTFVEMSVSVVEEGTAAKILTDPSLFRSGFAAPTIQLIGTMSKTFILTASTDSKSVIPLSVSVFMSKCDVGEMSTPWDNEFSNCQECPIEFYNINGDMHCYPCPDTATCYGGSSIVSKDGYYVFIDNSTRTVDMIKCPPTFCEEDNKCGDNREGFVCSVCEPDYAEWGGKCTYCPKSNDGLIVGVYFIIWGFILALYFIPSVNSSITKILAYYIQIIQIVVFPTSSWILETYSLVNLRLSTLNFCLGPLSYYNRFLLDMLVPLLCAANVLFLYLIFELVHRARARIRGVQVSYNRGNIERCIRSLCFIALFFFSSVSSSAFKMLSCEEQLGHKVISDSPSNLCEGSEYSGYVAVAYCVLIIYIAPLAFMIYGFLYRFERKSMLRTRNTAGKYGVFFLSYTRKYYWWESVIILRRLSYSIILIALYKTEVARQNVFSTLSIIYFGTHVYYHPFASNIDNKIEAFSLLIISVLSSVAQIPTTIRSIMLLLPIGLCIVVLAYTICREFLRYRKRFSQSNMNLIEFSKQFIQEWTSKSFYDTNGMTVEPFDEKDIHLRMK